MKPIRLARHNDIEIRIRANFSLGRIEYGPKDELVKDAISCLELSVISETDDRLLSGLIKSAFGLCKQSSGSQIERIVYIIDKALLKGNDYALHAGTELFGLHFDELPNTLLDGLLSHLLRVKLESKNSLDNIDYGLVKLLQQENQEKGITFLETLLLAHEDLTLAIFDSVMREIFKNNKNLFNRLMTRWFIKGDRALCKGINSVVSLAHDQNIQLTIEPAEFDASNPFQIIFIARKSVGYLFSKPVTAASVIVSLLHIVDDLETAEILINLLFDPLLLSYPGMVKGYLIQKMDNETEKVKRDLEIALKLFDDYITNIKSTGNIRELHPSQSQREIYNRRFSRIMSQSMKDAEKEAIFLSLVSRSVLLYGRKSIDYMYNVDGQSNRTEMSLESHSVEMEVPRIVNIDPIGLDYALRVFRVEQIKL